MSPAEAKHMNRLVAKLVKAAQAAEVAGAYPRDMAKIIRLEFTLAQHAYQTFVRTLTESPK